MKPQRADHDEQIPTRRIKFAGTEPSYGDLSTAIAQFEQNPRRIRAESDFAPHRDAVITGVSFGEMFVRFALSDDSTLTIELRDGVPTWTISSSVATPTGVSGDPPFVVQLLDADGGSSWRWERKRLLESRVGLRAYMLSAGVATLYFYTRSSLILNFDAMLDAETGTSFLSWCETD